MTIKYTEEQVWIRTEGANSDLATVGITHHAQDALGDVVFVELPSVGSTFKKGDVAGVVESVKAAADINMPIAGVVVAANDELAKSPQSINADAYGAWMFRIKPDNIADLGRLMDAAAYAGHAEHE